MTVLIDSWAWFEYWRDAPRARHAAEYIEGDEDALASAINLAEIYHWVLSHYDRKTADAKRATVERRCLVLPVDTEVAVTAAKIKREEHLALADSIVLATGRLSGATVVTGDADLRGKKGVIYLGS